MLKFKISPLLLLVSIIIILMGLATAQCEVPLKGVFFSTEEDFVTQGPKPSDGNPIISDGDLLNAAGYVYMRNYELLGVFKASSATSMPQEVRLSEEDRDRTIELGISQRLSISLSVNPSTGYIWEPREEIMLRAEGILRQVGLKFEPESALLGAPGEMILNFEAVGLGSIGLELVYWRPWEREPVETYLVTLEVVLPLRSPTSTSDPPSPQLPSAFDWRNLNGVTPVKDQDGCGSCWAFGTVGPLESNIRIQDGVIKDLSEQYLVSCNTDGWGCSGGWWAHDYHEWKSNPCDPTPGAVLETGFPYTANDDPCCVGKCPCSHPYKIVSWHCIGAGATKPSCWTGSVLPTDDLKQSIYNYGPISAAVYVGYAFIRYTAMCDGDGVLEPNEVFETNEAVGSNLNHAVVLVGWDDNVGTNGAWILRNSWGTNWGEKGYMYIGYGISNVGSCANYIIYAPVDLGVDLGLDAADVIDIEKRFVAFSTELDHPEELFTAGDLLATNGAILPNSALLIAFDIPHELDLGLDALHFTGKREAIIEFLEMVKKYGREYWLENPKELIECLEKYGIDIWFSTEGTAPTPEKPKFLDGDLLSAATGKIVIPNSKLLPPSVPAGIPERGVDFGLDAVTLDKEKNIEFSTEILYEDKLSFTDGDVLLQGDGVTIQNIELIKSFEPKAKELGLDALSFYLYLR